MWRNRTAVRLDSAAPLSFALRGHRSHAPQAQTLVARHILIEEGTRPDRARPRGANPHSATSRTPSRTPNPRRTLAYEPPSEPAMVDISQRLGGADRGHHADGHRDAGRPGHAPRQARCRRPAGGSWPRSRRPPRDRGLAPYHRQTRPMWRWAQRAAANRLAQIGRPMPLTSSISAT